MSKGENMKNYKILLKANPPIEIEADNLIYEYNQENKSFVCFYKGQADIKNMIARFDLNEVIGIINVTKEKNELENLRFKADACNSMNRLAHLLKSKVVSAYDKVHPKTKEYIKNIEKFDREFYRYKSAYEVISNSNSCNNCKRKCSSRRIGDKVVYNCPIHKK